MHTLLSHDLARQVARERQAEAAAYSRAARLVSVRRWQRRAEVATHRARLARLAVR
ncbi:MAG: hypothetical protein JWP11_339 [Frankiales bacterium]|nr:hypothetical protein [Frankiales bacterium]